MNEIQVGERLVFVNANGPSWMHPLARIRWAARHRTLRRTCVVAYKFGVDEAVPGTECGRAWAWFIANTSEPTVTIAPEREKIGGKE